MYRTIQLSSCISVQGETAAILANGEVVIRDGMKFYRGRPIPGEVAPRLTAAIIRLFRMPSGDPCEPA